MVFVGDGISVLKGNMKEYIELYRVDYKDMENLCENIWKDVV